MKDQNWRNFVDDRKARILSLVRYAQLQQLDEGDHARYKHASETLVLAEKETNQLIDDLNAAIAAHDEKGDVLKMEAAAALQESRQRSSTPEADETSPDKGKAAESSASELDADAGDNDLPRTPAGEEHATKRRALQARHREYRVTLHRVKFLQVRSGFAT
jgi:E3 ubiquitin-protein ligase SHPRH